MLVLQPQPPMADADGALVQLGVGPLQPERLVLGLRIAEGRRERRWTQAELCERAGISKATLRNAEHGEPTVAPLA